MAIGHRTHLFPSCFSPSLALPPPPTLIFHSPYVTLGTSITRHFLPHGNSTPPLGPTRLPSTYHATINSTVPLHGSNQHQSIKIREQSPARFCSSFANTHKQTKQINSATQSPQPKVLQQLRKHTIRKTLRLALSFIFRFIHGKTFCLPSITLLPPLEKTKT